MSRLTDLIAQAKAKDPLMGADLEREFKALSSRRSFGLNFERHRPETVELPQRPIRKGDKVHILPPRGETSRGEQKIWTVTRIEAVGEQKIAHLLVRDALGSETKQVNVSDLVVVAEFRDKIFPGLVSTGKVENGAEKPFHSVINGENYHALKALTFTHRGKIDAIYIDPPYNTGAKDWKYNNDYVDSEDLYRHSKWLAFMERRLKLAKQLLNPKASVLILTIDEKEVNRIALLLEQLYPEADVQMVTTVINPKGSTRGKELARVDEYYLICYFGEIKAIPTKRELLENSISSKSGKTPQIWYPLIRSGTDIRREDNKTGFYPIYIDKIEGRVVEIGEPLLPVTLSRDDVEDKPGLKVIWPTLADGSDGRWQVSFKKLKELVEKGMVRVGKVNSRTGQVSITYLKAGEIRRLESGEITSKGKNENGVLQLEYADLNARRRVGKTVWNTPAHDAGEHGSKLLRKMLPGRKFPFPKSLYAVEDALRFFIEDKKDAVVLDFFAGSGTTSHAVMRLNKQDNGRRLCISITNNEVAVEEQKSLKMAKLRPGDKDWERLGICEYVTKPRIKAAITGETHDGSLIKGDYRFVDEFPMSDGLAENAEFFTLTYETPIAVNHNLSFSKIAPLLWLRAGSKGNRIESIPDEGWDVADTYGVLFNLDKTREFCSEVTKRQSITTVYVITNDDRRFQSVVRNISKDVEVVRLYESYLNNFQFTNGD
ncbi:site-specific DNA-methyltransferase [Shewanella waksmanii]|uniref:site-specific DNA-methyltransferase n=1 Tax=Shewanella waksmanii TaxID=213783 RepID=UPI003736DDBC